MAKEAITQAEAEERGLTQRPRSGFAAPELGASGKPRWGTRRWPDYFWVKVDKNGPVPEHRPELGACWIWHGTTTGKTGYGQTFHQGKKKLAHRAAYELEIGSVPEGMTLDHLCRNRLCVNPKHMEAVPHRENVLRGTGPTAVNAQKTHCVNGHSLADAVARSDGGRRCAQCRRDRYDPVKRRQRYVEGRG